MGAPLSKDTPIRKLGILAGGGAAPHRIIEACQKKALPFFVFCLERQADVGLAEGLPHEWLPLGAGARLKKLLANQEISHIVMIGRVRRPSLLEIKPDWWALKALTRIGIHALGDDGLLRAIGQVLEDECGVQLVGAHEIFADLIAPVGVLTATAPDEAAQRDMRRGIDVAHALGALDVGQSVVVQQGIVLGVEAIEGTDALIARTASLRREGAGGVLVKLAKPQQDGRLDLPTIGPDTVASCVAAGVRGIAVEGGRSQIVDRAEVVRRADEAGLFVIGLSEIDLAP